MLELRGVSAGYDGVSVLRGVTLTVDGGSVVALLGPNGAGKTTLLNVASGTVGLSDGSVWLEGHDVSSLQTHRRAQRGMCHIPEGRGIFPSLTVRQNIGLFRRSGSAGSAEDMAVDLFPQLAKLMRRTAGTLSGGEQQMLALVRSFLADAKIVMLDEVSMGLAPHVVDEVFGFVRRLVASGRSLLIVEQYVQRALEVADTAYLLDRGEVAYSGPAGALDADVILKSYVGVDSAAAR